MTQSLRASQPRYQRIKRAIQSRLRTEGWQADERIPGEMVLARQYQVSTGTIRQAINALTDEGWLYRQRGRGTFVARQEHPSSASRESTLAKGLTFGIAGCQRYPHSPEAMNRVSHMVEAFEHAVAAQHARLRTFTFDDQEPAAFPCPPEELAHVDGILLAVPGRASTGEQLIDILSKLEVPLVAAPYWGQRLVSSIHEDAMWGMGIVLDHLLELGHKRIDFARFSLEGNGKDEFAWSAAREQAFRDACRSRGLPLTEAWIHHAPLYSRGLTPSASTDADQIAWGRMMGQELLARSDHATALIAGNDWVALGLLEAAREMKIRVPEEWSIVGFDNRAQAGWANLTTLAPADKEMGRAAAEMLIDMCLHPNTARVRQEICRPTLIRRCTTGPCGGRDRAADPGMAVAVG